VVTREELQQALWPADTFVELDQGLNTVINKIRQALGDSADSPRYVETLARRGYRFLGSLDVVVNEATGSGSASGSDLASVVPARQWTPVLPWALVAILTFVVVFLAVAYLRQRTVPLPPSGSRLPSQTSSDGVKLTYRSSPDGRRIVFPGTVADGVKRLWLRSLDSHSAQGCGVTTNFPEDNTPQGNPPCAEGALPSGVGRSER
jgi:hypothetical protein